MPGTGSTYTHLGGLLQAASSGHAHVLAAPQGANPPAAPMNRVLVSTASQEINSSVAPSSASLVSAAPRSVTPPVPSTSGSPALVAPMGVNPYTPSGSYLSMDKDLAVAAMNSVSDMIDNDLHSLEQEVAARDGAEGENYFTDLKEFCADIEKRVKTEFKEAGEKLARLDVS